MSSVFKNHLFAVRQSASQKQWMQDLTTDFNVWMTPEEEGKI